MSGTSSSELLEQLTRNSTPYHDPLTRIGWDRLDSDAFWLPEPAISLYGLPEYATLTEPQRQRLSQLEFISFITAGVWLEGIFMRRIADSFLRSPRDLTRRTYELHELREEAGHSLMFLDLIRRYGLESPPRHFWRFNLVNALGRYAPFNSAAFWVAVLVGESVPDRLNRYLRKHRETICPVVYEMASLHVVDEARHIAHARQLLAERVPYMPRWQLRILQPVLQKALREFVRMFYFPQAPIYEQAGLTPGRQWARAAAKNPHRHAFVQDTLQSALRMLHELGLDLRWP